MIDTSGDEELEGAQALIRTINRLFKGIDRPATAEELARLYGAMAAQHEATLACLMLVLKANPQLAKSSEGHKASVAVEAAVDELASALTELAKASMSDEDRAILEGGND